MYHYPWGRQFYIVKFVLFWSGRHGPLQDDATLSFFSVSKSSTLELSDDLSFEEYKKRLEEYVNLSDYPNLNE